MHEIKKLERARLYFPLSLNLIRGPTNPIHLQSKPLLRIDE